MDTPVTSLPVTFAAPMPGFEDLHNFSLRSVEGAAGLYALEAGATPVRLFLADAAVFAPAMPRRSRRRRWRHWRSMNGRNPRC